MGYSGKKQTAGLRRGGGSFFPLRETPQNFVITPNGDFKA